MSGKIAGLVLDHGPREHGPMIVLLLLAERADAETWVCWPSRADLVERGRMSNASVTRHLRALERAEWISRRPRFNQSSVFRVNVAKLLARAAEREAVRRVPRGFEPFPEEVEAAVRLAQGVDSKGDAHGEHADAHGEHADAHGEQGNLSLTAKEPRRAVRAKVSCSRFAKRLPPAVPSGAVNSSARSARQAMPAEVADAVRSFHLRPIAAVDRPEIARWLWSRGVDVLDAPGLSALRELLRGAGAENELVPA